jgi:hypothetical protein
VPRVLINRSLGQPSLVNQQVSNRFVSVDYVRVVKTFNLSDSTLNPSESVECQYSCNDVSTPRRVSVPDRLSWFLLSSTAFSLQRVGFHYVGAIICNDHEQRCVPCLVALTVFITVSDSYCRHRYRSGQQLRTLLLVGYERRTVSYT